MQLRRGVTCAVVQVDGPTDGVRTATLIDTNLLVPGLSNAGAVTRALDQYHGALVEITDAKDRKELDAASAETCKAMTSLAAAVNPLGAVGVGAVCRLAATVTGIVLDQRRYEVLKLRVGEADDNVVPKLATYLEDVLGRAKVQRTETLRTLARADAVGLPIAARASRQGGRGHSGCAVA
jgi:hypothetical protein